MPHQRFGSERRLCEARRMLVVLRAVAMAGVLLAAHPALAQTATPSTTDQARELGERGVSLYDAGEYKRALALFQRAEDLHHAPTLVLYLARCNAKLGHLKQALALYREVIAEALPKNAPAQFAKARAAALAELDPLMARIPTVAVTVDAPPTTTPVLTIDGRTIPKARWGSVELDPGDHTFEVSAEGFAPVSKNVSVPEGERVAVTLALVAPEPAPAPVAPAVGTELPLWPAWVGLGLGGAALVAGMVTGGLHVAKVSDLKERCRPDNRCPAADQGEADEAQVLATVSTATTIAGLALSLGAAAYAVIVVFAANDEVAVHVTPTGAALAFRF